ncbi:zf-HC2 domain-containing protein [Paenibacillus sp. IB182496]|uniref:Anti-sigma-W factor RsiW n=1 Tax=Paenibacillus sabuli TaxID=2772509 RepID=A0A927GQN3_9BACL|nr:zf-HC2 domain-containing protein [Paenibacillus sabuli]MBD2844080.1 zf-HC2 domain-containing protein [Paenibacillus sabuli]
MKCNVAILYMHDYLDDELPAVQTAELKTHLQSCEACKLRFEQLKRTEAFAMSALSDTSTLPIAAGAATHEAGSDRLSERIMGALPTPSRKRSWTRMFRNHPAITVAAVFVLLMMTSFFSMWGQDTELVVSGTDLQHVVIEGDTVIVPEGVQVNGNLTVENGKADIQGEVAGDLIVIDGSTQLASTAKIIGQNREINQALDWLWYKVTQTVSGFAN